MTWLVSEANDTPLRPKINVVSVCEKSLIEAGKPKNKEPTEVAVNSRVTAVVVDGEASLVEKTKTIGPTNNLLESKAPNSIDATKAPNDVRGKPEPDP